MQDRAHKQVATDSRIYYFQTISTYIILYVLKQKMTRR